MRIPCYLRSWHWITIMMVAILCASGARAANVAAGKPAFASINTANAGLATDNDQNTFWQPTGSPSLGIDWLGVDITTPTAIKGVRVYWGDTRPSAFTIQVATNVTTNVDDPNYGQGDWQTIDTYTGGEAGNIPPPSPYYVEIASNTTAYRYVRVNATAAPNADWGIRELQVLDAPLAKITGTAQFGATGLAESIITLAGPGGTRSVEGAANGTFSFAGLDPGTYTLRAWAPGRYAPVTATVEVAAADVVQNLTFTTPVVNSTAPIPSYTLDFIASANNPADRNAAVDPLAIQAELLPPGEQVWMTNTALPQGAVVGESLPTSLRFFMPPTADGKNNVLSALNVTIPFAPANYTAVYFLQTALEGNYYTTATLHYTDGTSELATTTSGNTLYGFQNGANGDFAGIPGEDEVVAMTFNEMYGAEAFPITRPWNLFVRQLPVNSAKVLESVEFDGNMAGPGSTTLAKGLILGWSADSLAAPPAVGSISGVVRGPGNAPVAGAIVNLDSFRIITDATGAFTFKGLPAGQWTVSARKPAFFATVSRTVTLTAGQNATGQDIVFAAPAPFLATGIGAPAVDLISGDTNINDFQWTGWMPGREYFPTGLWRPAMGGSPPQYDVQTGAPENLEFMFTNFGDTAVAPGQPGYPEGGTPSAQILSGSTFLAPPVKTTAVYLATIGAEGGNIVNPVLVYTDGTVESRNFSIGDWFAAPTPDEYPYIAMHGRHARTDAGGSEANFGEGTNIRLNAVIVTVNPNKQLKYIQFGQHQNPQTYPIVLAVSWETETVQPAPSDLVVNVKTAGGANAARAMVLVGPYTAYTDTSGNARFYGIPSGLTLGIGAYISGVTKQARTTHTMTTGSVNNVSITLPSAAPIFVPLHLSVDHDALAMPDMPGDYKTGRTNDRGFRGEVFPASLSSTTVANVPYRMPNKETFYNNVLRVNGQNLKVVPGNYSSLDILITGPGIGGNTRVTYVTLNYADGSSQLVQYGVHDWVKGGYSTPDVSNREFFWRQINPGAANPFRSVGRHGPANTDTADTAFLPQILPVDASKTLTSIQLLPMLGGIDGHDFEILAATLEANEITGTSGTVTGRVVGQPMGAATAGPLPLTQVILDDAHATYTDANGNFSIPNAPLGAGSLKVIPYGTGLITKSFPVTVTAGTVNTGDLNMGAATTQARIVMDTTNTVAGVTLREPAVLPSGRYNVNEAHTVPVVVDGKTARETVNGRMYFDVDDAWLWRGMQGNNGLTIANLGTPTQDITKLAPTIYVQIEYYDKGTDRFGFEMNRMEEWNYQQVATDPILQTTRLTNMWHNPGQEVIKTGTNTWKKVVLTLDPAVNNNAFGAYNGQHLIADFLIDDRDGTEYIHSVTFSTTPDFTVPSVAADILRAAGGLTAVSSAAELAGLDQNNDGRLTLIDAAMAAREAQGL